MKKILTTQQSIQIATKLSKQGKRIVLAGGCFDILHIGHITFLERAKQQGDILMVFVEHDTTIKKTKGHHRPLNRQEDRATILAHLTMVDYVITLPARTDDASYDNLVMRIKPAIIATTAGDVNRSHKERQAQMIAAQVADVTPPVFNQSTTKLVNILKKL